MDIQAYWLKQIATLKVDKARGNPAPHKPLLLLVILDLAEENCLQQEILPLTGELAFRFCTYWTVVASRRSQKPDIRLPFHHLNSAGFWKPLTEEGKLSPDRKLTAFAKLDSSFLNCLCDENFRNQARRLLVGKYFPSDEQVGLCALLDIPVPSGSQILQETAALEKASAAEKGREAKFRLKVIPAYDYTCALTGYRLVTITTGSIVDAAHIHRFANSRNNDPRNGIALSKNAHWLFDAGLWTLGDDYRVRVASTKFDESGDQGFLLKSLEGKRISLPKNPQAWPDPVHLAWHRTNRFQGL
ncbi:MAG TPA: HNH endonuclease [Verrucomicrobiae bacterium]|nr:HNH endonuclease [Verrucomicrobiae bacterium]